LTSNEVKDIDFGNKTLVGSVLKNDFIDVDDDDEYLKMSCTKRVKKRKFCDLQSLEYEKIDSPIVQELIKKLRKIFVNSGAVGKCLCGGSTNDLNIQPEMIPNAIENSSFRSEIVSVNITELLSVILMYSIRLVQEIRVALHY